MCPRAQLTSDDHQHNIKRGWRGCINVTCRGKDIMCVVRTLSERFILIICSVYTFIDLSRFSKIKTKLLFLYRREALEKVARGTVK